MHSELASHGTNLIPSAATQPINGQGALTAGHSNELSVPAQLASLLAENHELRAQLDQFRSERSRLLDTQRRVLELLGTQTPERLLHDLRNVLNERELLKALVDEL